MKMQLAILICLFSIVGHAKSSDSSEKTRFSAVQLIAFSFERNLITATNSLKPGDQVTPAGLRSLRLALGMISSPTDSAAVKEMSCEAEQGGSSCTITVDVSHIDMQTNWALASQQYFIVGLDRNHKPKSFVEAGLRMDVQTPN